MRHKFYAQKVAKSLANDPAIQTKGGAISKVKVNSLIKAQDHREVDGKMIPTKRSEAVIQKLEALKK